MTTACVAQAVIRSAPAGNPWNQAMVDCMLTGMPYVLGGMTRTIFEIITDHNAGIIGLHRTLWENSRALLVDVGLGVVQTAISGGAALVAYDPTGTVGTIVANTAIAVPRMIRGV